MELNNLHPVARTLCAPLLRLAGRIYDEINRPYVKLLVLGAAVWMATQRQIAFNFSIGSATASVMQIVEDAALPVAADEPVARARNVSQLVSHQPATQAAAPAADTDKRRRQLAYVRKYASLAREEMRAHGIPASVTLAQGLLESDIGQSRLATENNNHFGIKCFSRTCAKGHCSNFSDDSHKDFFRIYGSVKESYRAHSQLLQKDRYRRLFRLDRDDYRGWARGLRKAGYATDPEYHNKLIRLIEELDLHEYDD